MDSMTIGTRALNCYTVVCMGYLVAVMLLLHVSLILKLILHTLLASEVMCPSSFMPSLSQCAVKVKSLHAVYISVLRVAPLILRHSTALQ